MPTISKLQGQEIKDYVDMFKSRFNSSFLAVLQHLIIHFERTQEVLQVLENLDRLYAILDNNNAVDSFYLPENVVPCLKRVLLSIRREQAKSYESAKSTTIHPEIINKLESNMQPLDELINQEWVLDAKPMKMPRLSDFLSIQVIEEHFRVTQVNSVQREYDEKFHILQAPKHFLTDLSHFRWHCELRGTSVAVAHIDIDDFKRFNSKYGHVEVDRRILPQFMRLLEAHVFSHGFAYRYGGDEYILLLPNMDYDLIGSFLHSLRKKVEDLQYAKIEDRTTVSIGFCYIDSDSYLTDREAEERANRAMNFAKLQGGKNCVSTFLKSRYDDESLRIINSA